MRAIDVETRDGVPVCVEWRKQRLPVTGLADHWVEQGRWWNDEPPLCFFLVETERRRLLLCQNSVSKSWYAKPL